MAGAAEHFGTVALRALSNAALANDLLGALTAAAAVAYTVTDRSAMGGLGKP